MKLYLEMFWASVRDVKPSPTTDTEVLASAACMVLGAICLLFVIANLFVGQIIWPPFLVGGVGLIFIGLHIETMARIREDGHVCDEECR
jgi:hypothetical protein